MKTALLLALTAMLCGCEMTPGAGNSVGTTGMAATKSKTAELRGMNFAQNRCADCHAVERLQTTPVPSAPSFEDVANAPGVTRESLSHWLKTSHDYPREMYFEIPVERIDDLVAYLLTLRSEDYEPSIGWHSDDLSNMLVTAGSLETGAAATR